MKKRLSLVCLLIVLVAVFAVLFTACKKEPETLESLQNEYGITVTGGGFEKGSILITEEIKADTVEGAAALAAIANKEYDKDGRVLILEIHVIKERDKIQPKNKVTVSVPMPGIEASDYVVFHIKSDNTVVEIIPTVSDGVITFETSSFSRFIIAQKAKCVHDWGDFRVIERATCTSKGVTERTCKLCGITEQRDTPEASHRYSESVSIEKNDCLHTGIITRLCEICGNKVEESFTGPHTLGAWIEAKDPSLFETGCIGHYECSVCGGAFDADQQPIDNEVIPKLTPKFSICLDGVPVKELTVDEAVSGYIILSASGIEVKVGQTVSICKTDDPDTALNFTVRESDMGVIGIVLGNVDPETKKIRTDSVSGVTVEMTSGGVFSLSMDGYAHSGIVIEATKSFGGSVTNYLPMNRVDYYGNSDMPAYVYGILGTDKYTSFRIIDLDTDTVYDYYDIAPSMSWNTWSYSKGENDGILFSEAITNWVVAFDVGGDGKIHLDKFNYQSVRIPTQVDISDGTKVDMEKLTYEAGSEEYDYYTWPLFNGCSYRTEVWLDYIGTESITVYRAVVDIDRNESFTISAGSVTLGYEQLCRVDVSGRLTTSGKGIKLSEADRYIIEYIPFCDVINIRRACQEHEYGEWQTVELGDCVTKGKSVRVCVNCDKEEYSYPYGEHSLSELIPAVAPTLFETGNIEYYRCSVCEKYFSSDMLELASVTIPKLEPKVSVCLDGVTVANIEGVFTEDYLISFSLEKLAVTAGKTLTICLTDYPDTVFDYTVTEKYLSVEGGIIKGNVDPETHKICTTSESNLTFTIRKSDKAELAMDGYKHSGVVIEITSSRTGYMPIIFPMNEVDYYGDPDTQAYVFGIFGTDSSASFRIIDLDTNTIYDYDDISDSMSWNTWSYSRGESGEIVFAGGVENWLIAFDIGGDRKITPKLFNYSTTEAETTLGLYRGSTLSESISMEKVNLEVASEEYNYYTWALNNAVFNRTENWLDRIDLEKLFVYRTVIEVERNQEVSVKSGSTTMYGTYLSEVIAPDGAIGKALTSNRIRFNAAGKYVVEYLPFCEVINIYEYIEETPDPEPHEHVYIDGKCECGEIDPDYAPSHKHEYVDSKCECGAVDSNYKGIVIEINGEKFAMNFETYPSDEKTSYVYGYVYINAGDKLLIRDTESGAVWGYDDIDEAFSWNTWDYHRGDNGEIVFDFTARYAFEFDCDGCKKLYITKVFAPNHGESFGIDFEGEREDVIFDSLNLSASADAEGEFMWMLSHDTTMNCSDFTEYINENGLWFYYAIIDLEEGESFSLKNLTTGDTIGADYMSDITGDIAAITRDGDLVSVQKSGSFYIIYLPAFNSFAVECDTTDPLSEINLYAGDKAVTLIPDENGDIFYEGFESTTYHIISIDDARFSPLPIILDESMDKTLVDLTVSGDYYVAYPTKEGTYNLRYNVYTGVLYLEYVGGVEEEETVPYQIYISYDHKLSLKQSTDNPDEYYHLAVTMGAWDEIKVLDSNLDYITNMTLAAGTTDIVTDGSIITFQTGGTYDFYINKTTHEIRFVASTGGGDVGGDGEIDFSDGLYLGVDYEDIRVYPNEDGDVKYIGLEVTDDTVILMKTLGYEYLPIILDETVSSSIASVYISDDCYMLFFYKNGTVNITYNVYTGIMHIEMTSVTLEGAKVVLFNNGSMTNAYSDADGNVVFERFVLEESGPIILNDAAYENLPMVLDPEMDTTLASLYEYEGTTMLIINGAGTYNLYYNLTTNVVLLEAVPET